MERIMSRRPIAVSILFVWLAFLAVEFFEQTGLFVFSDQALDNRVDAAVLSFGLALKMSEPEMETSASVLSSHFRAVRIVAVFENDGAIVRSRGAATLGSRPAICQLHCTFLI